MQVLYKDEYGNYAVMEVLKASYIEDEDVLELCGTEEDIAVKVTEKEAKKIVRELYEKNKADVSAYPYCERDLEYDEFFDEDDEDDGEEDFIDRMIDLDFGTGSKNRGIVFGDDE